MFEGRTVHATRVRIRFDESGDESEPIRCHIDVLDSELHGHGAKFRIARTVDVHDSRGINESGFPFERKIGQLGASQVIEVPRSALQIYSYKGAMIDISVRTELIVDDSVLFDTQIEMEHNRCLDRAPAVSTDVEEIVEPSDAFDFLTNLKAIPFHNRMITIALLIIGLAVIGLNSLVGWHDETSPEAEIWFYDHVDSEGESESPLMKSLMGSGALGIFLWGAVRSQLRKYMTFELIPLKESVGRSHSVPASHLIRGRSRVDLHDVHLRIVACNIEKGQYKRGSGTDERTVSFSEPCRAVVLYESRVPLIPAGRPVEQFLSGEVRFEPMFRALYPRQMLSSSHGLDLHWEIQLIHDELVDQELVCPCDAFSWEDFLEG